MTLDDVVNHKTLFAFGVDEQPSSGSRPFEFSELQHPHYRLKYQQDILQLMNTGSQAYSTAMENMSIGFLHSINECFTEQFSYFPDKEDNCIVTYIGEFPNLTAVALAMYNEEGFTTISCASGVHEFLQNNSKAIFANIEPVMERLGGNQRPLIMPVIKVSVYDLLRKNLNLTVSDPVEPRPTEFESLEDYMAKGRNEIRIGDIIHGVKLTNKHKRSSNGTFTLSGDKSPVQIIVQDSSQFDIVNIQFTEQINPNLYKAVLYTQR